MHPILNVQHVRWMSSSNKSFEHRLAPSDFVWVYWTQLFLISDQNDLMGLFKCFESFYLSRLSSFINDNPSDIQVIFTYETSHHFACRHKYFGVAHHCFLCTIEDRFEFFVLLLIHVLDSVFVEAKEFSVFVQSFWFSSYHSKSFIKFHNK